MTALVKGTDGVRRCAWGASTPDYAVYHDDEWGRPVFDDVRLYEKLCLEGFQSGLSWLTILRKRENFRRAFEGFEPQRVARFGPFDGYAAPYHKREQDHRRCGNDAKRPRKVEPRS